MKILHIIDVLDSGGAERALVDLINLQASYGLEVELLVILGNGVLDIEVDSRISITYLNRSFKYSVAKALMVVSLCRSNDLVHVHMRQNLMYLRYCSLWASIKPIPVLFHDQYGSIETDRKLGWRIKFALAVANAYIGVSDTITSWAKHSGMFPHDKLFTLPNTARRLKTESTKGENEKGIQIISVGNFRKIKNHEFAISLMKHLSDDYRLDIYGTKVDKVYFDELQNFINLSNLSHRVQLITGVTNIQERLYDYDIALHTSLSETGPIVLVEYAAQNLPFVAHKTGQTAQEIAENLPELFLTNFELIDWIERINLVLKQRLNYTATLGDIYENRFSEKEYLNKCLDIYAKTLNQTV